MFLFFFFKIIVRFQDFWSVFKFSLREVGECLVSRESGNVCDEEYGWILQLDFVGFDIVFIVLVQQSRRQIFYLLWSGDNSIDCIMLLRDVKLGIDNCVWCISFFVDIKIVLDRVEGVYRFF